MLLAASLTFTPQAVTSPYANLPEIGTAAAATLSINKEIEYGDAYMRMLRASMPIVNDPLLSEYISALGVRLLSKANDVKTPFTFFLVQNKDINAFAFFGGHIGLHTGLFLHAQTESELASVMSHEIAHLTQRHLARSMEEQAKQTPLTMAALIGSLMLAIAAPQAGIAAVQASAAASMQRQLNYSRGNEQEADRIGIETLSRADFNVNAMPLFFTRMADQYRFTSKPPQFLLTHPLPDSRITDARARAQQYPKRIETISPAFELARARIVARYANFDDASALSWFNRQLKKAPINQINALNYGKALVYIDTREFTKAQKLLAPLIKAQPNNRFYLDAMTDLDLGQDKFTAAISRLDTALSAQPNNPVLQLNRNYALVEASKFKAAIDNLQRYTHQHQTDLNGWSLLQEAYDKHGVRHGALAAQAEIYALRGQWDKAIKNYSAAGLLVPLASLDQARYDARIDQLRMQQARFLELKN